MYFLKKLIERYMFLAAYLRRDENIEGFEFNELLHSLFRSASVKRLGKGESFRPVPGNVTDGCRKVTVAGKTVYWPEEADPNGLMFTYWEVYRDVHGHMFDTHGTELREDDVVFDCGACEGLFTVKAIEKGAGKVYCFEPGRKLADCLRAGIGREITDNRVEIAEMLLGSVNGELMFMEDPANPSVGRILPAGAAKDASAYPVKITTIDDFCTEKSLGRLDYIKADVEGAEVDLVRGASKSIERFGPRLAIAVYHEPGNAREIISLVRNIDRRYTFRLKGLACHGGVVRPMILHAVREDRD